MNRGEIWWADLPVPQRSEPGYRRPVLVVQADSFNQSHIRTVVCAAITSNTRLSDMPGNVLLSAEESKLQKPSVVNVSQLITLDQAFLSDYVGTVSIHVMRRVNNGLKLVLDLP